MSCLAKKYGGAPWETEYTIAWGLIKDLVIEYIFPELGRIDAPLGAESIGINRLEKRERMHLSHRHRFPG